MHTNLYCELSAHWQVDSCELLSLIDHLHIHFSRLSLGVASIISIANNASQVSEGLHASNQSVMDSGSYLIAVGMLGLVRDPNREGTDSCLPQTTSSWRTRASVSFSRNIGRACFSDP